MTTLEARPAQLVPVDIPSPFSSHLGFRRTQWSDGFAENELIVRPEHMNRNGSCHGGILMTILDAACVACGTYPRDEQVLLATSASFTMHFVAAMPSKRILATAKCIKRGKSMFFASGDVRTESGDVLASGAGAYCYLK